MKNQFFNTIKLELESVILRYTYENNLHLNPNFCKDDARAKVVGACAPNALDNRYIKGCDNANKWFEKHNITASEAIEFVKQWEDDCCEGGFQGNTKSEYIANMIAYIISFDCFCKEAV